jgi:hypothetical protein
LVGDYTPSSKDVEIVAASEEVAPVEADSVEASEE